MLRSILKIYESRKTLRDSAIKPLTKVLDSLGFSPIFLTILSFIFGITAAVSLLFSKNFFLIFILLSTIFDGLDGSLARFQGKLHKNGFWIDYFSDRIVVLLTMVCVILVSDSNFVLVLLPVLYVIMHLIFILNKRRLPIMYFQHFYFLGIFFSFFWGSVFFILTIAVNFSLFTYFYFFSKKRSYP